MAYNPFDDIIEQDPAYMADGGSRSGIIKPVTMDQGPRYISQAIADFYGMLTPEEELKQQYTAKEESQQKLLQESQPMIQAIQQMQPNSREQLLAIKNLEEDLYKRGYQNFNIQEILGMTGQFLYGDQRKAFDKLAAAEPLTSEDRMAIAFAPLDLLDFISPGIVAKLAKRGFTKVDDVLKASSDIPEVKQVQDYFTGRQYTPEGVVYAPEMGGSGTVQSIAKTKKFEETMLEPYRDIFNEYVQQTEIPSAVDFRRYLESKNFPLTKDVAQGKPSFVSKDIVTDTRHLQRAMDYLSEGKVKIFAGDVRPWMLAAEDILKQSDKKLYPVELRKELSDRGFDISTNAIATWSKSKKGIDPAAAKNLFIAEGGFKKVASPGAEKRENILNQLETLKEDLIANPEKQGKGISNYFIDTDKGKRSFKSINTDWKAKSKRESLTDRPVENISTVVPKSLIDELYSLTSVPKGEGERNLFREYIPTPTKEVGNVYQQNVQKITDAYRSGAYGTFDEFEDLANAYGIQKVDVKDPELRAKRTANQDAINKLATYDEILQNKSGAFTKKQLDGYRKVVDDSKKLSNYTGQKFRNVLDQNPRLKQKVLDEYTKYYNKFPRKDDSGKIIPVSDEDKIQAATRAFDGHVSHVFRIADFKGVKGLEGLGDVSNMVRVNFGIENLALQQRAENVVDAAIAKIKRSKATKQNWRDLVPKDVIDALQYYDKLFERKGMALYRRLKKENLTPDVIEVVNTILDKKAAGTIKKLGLDDEAPRKYNDIFLGSEKPLSLEGNIKRFDQLMDYYNKNPEKFKVSMATQPNRKSIEIEGFEETPYFRRGFVETSTPDIEFETQFKRGGAVRMAMGGDPLQNLNQQQYSPDPAFDEDYFQQAVESGNLQAANLLNLFKVFKKPLSVATPENIKKLKEANEALAMPTPGAQQIAPLQAGEQDFFFKSYLLDQLADKNAPQAATPEAWKQYLIKGKKVPEAEITDTGILQYLEDTEKFYPGKKITKDDIQALYDTSPLGNIEVRVKDARPTIEVSDVPAGENTRDYLDFFADQGKSKHKGAGSAKIDEGAENYFEVVVNVPTLPGQEKAYVQSGHYPEPNVLGFTRVGTYKNNSGETVAVIQEMQTDMLTEVRKEQERLTAMVQHLKKRRQSHVDSIERERARGNDTSYYENNLRQFDTKYPPEKLKALEETTLIEPYPNIAAKDLIPEKTKSLNDIQNQIEELMMTNVEQYTDPAYKTKVYDLAQEQNVIFEELANMNRSANYKEMLKDFEVPRTKETEALRDIANRDYPPSDVRPVVTFPPIPFNKQADYVDLLLKSTIQAAKQKGINKIAIMPADVGANPRWGKTTLKASREDKSSGDKFRNLYDKVGVQQLKNIAKKYDGKVEIEKIVDPTKGEKGLSFYQKDVDGNYFLSKEDVLSGNLSFGEEKMFIDQQLARAAHDMGADNVVYTREVAPGQTMDYWVNPTGPSQGIPRQDLTFELVPVQPGEDINAALVKIEETNPQLVDMYTITFDPSQFEGPMYMFKKKSGGIIDKDRLISITDIYGEYGR